VQMEVLAAEEHIMVQHLLVMQVEREILLQ
jgi:hypothetical protein